MNFDEFTDGPKDLESSSPRVWEGAVRVTVADDHPVVTSGVCHLLGAIPNVDVVSEVHTVSDLLESLSRRACDVVICDYSFAGDPEPDGLRLLGRIHREYPDVKIIVLSVLTDHFLVHSTIQHGASAFLTKASEDLLRLEHVLNVVMRGGVYLDSQVTTSVMSSILNGLGHPTRSILLSPRELEVVRLFEQGMGVGEIAQRMRRSRKTISTQKANAMRKLGVSNDIELVDAVRRLL